MKQKSRFLNLMTTLPTGTVLKHLGVFDTCFFVHLYHCILLLCIRFYAALCTSNEVFWHVLMFLL